MPRNRMELDATKSIVAFLRQPSPKHRHASQGECCTVELRWAAQQRCNEEKSVSAREQHHKEEDEVRRQERNLSPSSSIPLYRRTRCDTVVGNPGRVAGKSPRIPLMSFNAHENRGGRHYFLWESRHASSGDGTCPRWAHAHSYMSL